MYFQCSIVEGRMKYVTSLIFLAAQCTSMLDNPVPQPNLPPLKYLNDQLVVWEGSTHMACRKYMDYLVAINPAHCGGLIQRWQRDHAAYSYDAVECTGSDKVWCDATFQCRVQTNYRGCTKAFFQKALSGRRAFKCSKSREPWIEPGLSKYQTAARCLQPQSVKFFKWQHEQKMHSQEKTKEEIETLRMSLPGQARAGIEIEEDDLREESSDIYHDPSNDRLMIESHWALTQANAMQVLNENVEVGSPSYVPESSYVMMCIDEISRSSARQ